MSTIDELKENVTDQRSALGAMAEVVKAREAMAKPMEQGLVIELLDD